MSADECAHILCLDCVLFVFLPITNRPVILQLMVDVGDIWNPGSFSNTISRSRDGLLKVIITLKLKKTKKQKTADAAHYKQDAKADDYQLIIIVDDYQHYTYSFNHCIIKISYSLT